MGNTKDRTASSGAITFKHREGELDWILSAYELCGWRCWSGSGVVVSGMASGRWVSGGGRWDTRTGLEWTCTLQRA